MADLVKTTIYTTMDLKQMLKKASFLSGRTQNDIVKTILNKGLEEYLKELEEKEKPTKKGKSKK